jgi:hypothetical protein
MADREVGGAEEPRLASANRTCNESWLFVRATREGSKRSQSATNRNLRGVNDP